MMGTAIRDIAPDPMRSPLVREWAGRAANLATGHPVGGSDTWCSPTEVTGPCADFFGGRIHTDPCSNERSTVNAIIEYTFGGLHRPWIKETYENPPFSKTHAFTVKALSELKHGTCTELVRLTMVATSTVWWNLMVKYKKRNPRFLFTKRLKFRGVGAADGARFDTVLTYFGPRWKQFDKTFAHLERWSAWGR